MMLLLSFIDLSIGRILEYITEKGRKSISEHHVKLYLKQSVFIFLSAPGYVDCI